MLGGRFCMTHYEDLAECDYFRVDHQGHLLAVGWLEWGREYPTGAVSEENYLHLQSLLQEPFEPIGLLGSFLCEFCDRNPPAGSANLFVPHDGDILVAPELILHYIDTHDYMPPERFLNAIMELPAANGNDYEQSLKTHAPYLFRPPPGARVIWPRGKPE